MCPVNYLGMRMHLVSNIFTWLMRARLVGGGRIPMYNANVNRLTAPFHRRRVTENTARLSRDIEILCFDWCILQYRETILENQGTLFVLFAFSL
jgi:hypothetical protein